MNINNDFEYYPEENKDNFNFKEFLSKYIKFWPHILVCMAIGFAVAYVFNKHQAPEYKIQSSLMIKEDQNNQEILDLTGSTQNPVGSGGQKLSNETYILKSKALASEVLSHLDFDVEYFNEGTFSDTEIYEDKPLSVEVDWNHSQLTDGAIKLTWKDSKTFTLEFIESEYRQFIPGKERHQMIEIPKIKAKTYEFGQWVELSYIKFKPELKSKENKGSLLIRLRDHQTLVKRYTGEDLEVAPLDATTSILGISLISSVPEKGRDYLNTLMETYLDNELKEKNRLASNTIDFIDSQVSDVADSLSFIESNLQNFRSNNRTYDIGTEGSTIFNKLSELESLLSQEQFKRDYYKNLERYLVREEYDEIVMPSGLGIEDPILNTLLQNLIVLQGEKSRYLGTLTETHPSVREVSRKIADQNASIKEVLQSVNENALLAIKDLQERIHKIEEEFSRLPATEQNLLRIQRKFTLNENIHTFLLQRRAESAITMASNTPSNKIIEDATPNYKPLYIKPLINYIIGLSLGFMFPVGIISMVVLLNNKIKDKNELKEKLNIPILSHIGHNKNKSNLVVLKENRSVIAEAFRSLRTNITFIVPKDKQLTIGVTSTIAGEGKTFSAMNLASAYSISGKRTILISCDLHKPKIFQDFKLKNTVGLSTFLSERFEDVSTVIQPTTFSKLDIISAGPLPPNPAELLANDRFEHMIEELKQKYDVIILDSPPIGLASEALTLMKLVDLTLYVLRYNYSNYAFINEVNQLKEGKGLKNIYAVFNDISTKDLFYGGYGYGYYQEDKKPNLVDRLFKGNKGRAAI